MNKKKTDIKTVPKGGCTLCGRLYSSFAFKGGYICEDCLQSIKEVKEESTSQPKKK